MHVTCKSSRCGIVYASLYLLTKLPTYLITYLLTNLITPYSTDLLEKLTVSQIFKKLPALNGTRKVITAFTGAHHLGLCSVRSIQSISHHSASRFPFYITPPSTPEPSKWSLTLRFLTKILHTSFRSPIRNTCFCHVILPDFISRMQIIKQLFMFPYIGLKPKIKRR